MITYTSELKETDWETLVDLYDETGMCLGLGRARELDK